MDDDKGFLLSLYQDVGNIFTLATFPKSTNRRMALNIIATYGRSLYALVCGLFISRGGLAALGKTDFGLYGVVGGMMMAALLAEMRMVRGTSAAVLNARQTNTKEQ